MHTKTIQYKEINKFLSAFSILQHNDGATVIASENNTYLVRNIQIVNSCGKQQNQELNTIINTLSQHQTFKSKNILALVDFDIIFNKSKTQSQIKAVYQYGRKSLVKEIEDRKQSEEYFDEDALWGLLYSIASALAYLEERSIIYGVIDAARVFLDNNLIAILDPSSTGIDPYQITTNRIYSPELLREDGCLEEMDMFKSDVFALGLLMLQCALLKMELYQYDENILNICLSEIKDLYSENFCQVIESMLDFQSDSRPSFADILKSISSMFEISSSEMQTLEPMGPDTQNDFNQMCAQSEFNEKQNIDILETEYIRYEEYHNTSSDDLPKAHLIFNHSRASQLSESAINESDQFSENSTLFIEDSMIKPFEKSRRIFKPKQIKQQLVDKDLFNNTDIDPISKIQTDRFREANLHRKSKTNWENECQNSRQSKKNQPLEEAKAMPQKLNRSHHQNFSLGVGFSPLNKQNLFTKPEIMNMIKQDIKKIQDRKKTFLNVNFSYLPQNQSRNPMQFKKSKQNNQKVRKSHLAVHQALISSKGK